MTEYILIIPLLATKFQYTNIGGLEWFAVWFERNNFSSAVVIEDCYMHLEIQGVICRGEASLRFNARQDAVICNKRLV